MRTKEIEIYLNSDDMMELIDNPTRSKEEWYSEASTTRDLSHDFKTRLIIDLPEKKIEISESQFDEILKDARSQYRDTSDCIWHLKQTLFGKEEK